MQISREIRKKLESSLPSYVLEYLTEKFEEAERYCEENKQLKWENMMLQQRSQQDQRSPIGFYPSPQRDYDYPYMRKEYYDYPIGPRRNRSNPETKSNPINNEFEMRKGTRNEQGGNTGPSNVTETRKRNFRPEVDYPEIVEVFE